jgi:spore maturation protein SpmA
MALNYIWIAFFVIAFIIACIKLLFFGDLEVFTQIINGTFDSAKTGFEISIGLTGAMTLWLGIMKIGENAGAINFVTRLINPFFSRLFPDIPQNHPVMGQMIMNLSANLLGLDNAATPLGLKAMQGLNEINHNKETASNAQIMFLVLHTSGLTLIPVSIMAYRLQAGALNPADIFIPCLLATFTATIAGILFVGIKQKLKFDKVLVFWIVAIIGSIASICWGINQLPQEKITVVSSVASSFILFGIIITFISAGVLKRINIYDSFIDGAKSGFETAIKIIPFLIGMLVAISVFRNSGAMDYLNAGIKWFFSAVGFDTQFVDALPVALMKPLSGSGSRALMVDTMKNFGADSFVGRLSSVIQGSADTTFYIVALYFGSVGIKNSRYAVSAGLFTDLIGIVTAILISYLFFG